MPDTPIKISYLQRHKNSLKVHKAHEREFLLQVYLSCHATQMLPALTVAHTHTHTQVLTKDLFFDSVCQKEGKET